jgi:hypothetical protein
MIHKFRPREVTGQFDALAEKLRSDQGEHAREVWTVKGKQAFEVDGEGSAP